MFQGKKKREGGAEYVYTITVIEDTTSHIIPTGHLINYHNQSTRYIPKNTLNISVTALSC